MKNLEERCATSGLFVALQLGELALNRNRELSGLLKRSRDLRSTNTEIVPASELSVPSNVFLVLKSQNLFNKLFQVGFSNSLKIIILLIWKPRKKYKLALVLHSLLVLELNAIINRN